MNIPRFTTISADMLKTQEYPKDLVPPGALTSIEDAVGRVIVHHLVMDEPLLEGKLAAKGCGPRHGRRDPQGDAGVHDPDPQRGVGRGRVHPPRQQGGRAADHQPAGSQRRHRRRRTTTLLQNVEILAVDQRIEAPAENKVDCQPARSVTLLVTPDQAAKLDLGQNKGTLHLSLRNPKDNRRRARPARDASRRSSDRSSDAPRQKPGDERAKDLHRASARPWPSWPATNRRTPGPKVAPMTVHPTRRRKQRAGQAPSPHPAQRGASEVGYRHIRDEARRIATVPDREHECRPS